ncbi:MAG TPA: ABC transporter permease [Gemmatimonadaceae bacterium]|nr:ABC transporter permease [Gemmatimonadaceae bacterium]
MAMHAVRALLGKDLRLFFSDRRAVITAFAMPIAIASFFGLIFRGQSGANGATVSRIGVLMVDLDTSVISRAIVAGVSKDPNLNATVTSLDTARARVRRGAVPVAVVIPAQFGDQAGRAFFRNTDKPVLQMLFDPSHATERAMVSGIMTQHVMESVSREMFGGTRGRTLIDETLGQLDSSGLSPGRRALLRNMLASVRQFNADTDSAGANGGGITMPYTVRDEAVTAGTLRGYNPFAHAFAGMGIQFLLMTAITLGIDVLMERQRGIWKRLRAAPLTRATLLGAKVLSGAVIGTMVLVVSFAFAILVWGVRISGSLAGFAGVLVACALMASAFGLLIAALGKTPSAARGVSIFATLIMVMLGGAWVPTFIFPAWLQQVTLVIPTRWAIDGFDAMTWRGLGFDAALAPIGILLAFTAGFLALALSRFRWEES